MKTLFIIMQLVFMTYNVENLFDTRHDSLKNDYEYLPTADKQWTQSRYNKKVHNIMQVVLATGDELPVLVGLCEVENDYVVKSMVNMPPYNKLGYGYIHYESPDDRGIDVALLYRKDWMNPVNSTPVKIELGENSTRDLLYVCGGLKDGSFIHVIQVHAPSRRGGVQETEEKRVAVAARIRSIVDSIQQVNPQAAIVIMGDFNDNPDDKAPYETLKAMPAAGSDFEDSTLYNLTWDGFPTAGAHNGSYNHAGEWDMLDQIIVSGAMLNGSCSIQLETKAHVFHPKWLQGEDGKPKRTYAGKHYEGGVSDHFPVTVRGNEK